MIFNHSPIFLEPHIWGKHYWFVIETTILAMDTKEKPSREFVSFFLYSLQNTLPCPTCREHYQKYFQKNDIDKLLTSKKEILLWIYHLKKEIQNRNGKKFQFSTFESYIKDLEEKYITKKEETLYVPSISKEKNFKSL